MQPTIDSGHRIAPYGTWSSPIAVDQVLGAKVGVYELHSDDGDLLWLQSVPEQDSRLTLLRRRDGQLTELTKCPSSVSSRVNEYGGGAWDVRGGVVVYCDDHDATVRLRSSDGTVCLVTAPSDRFRYGDLRVYPREQLILAVREESREHDEPATTIVALPWPCPGKPAGAGTVLVQGADFYACPELGPRSQLAWMQWHHPSMPWDASSIQVGRLTGALQVRDVVRVAGGQAPAASGVSVQHPRWARDGSLLFMSDESGYWNLHRWDGSGAHAVHHWPHDCDQPLWNLGNCSYAQLDDDRVLISYCDNGRVRLGIVSLGRGTTRPLSQVSDVDSVAATGEGCGAALIALPDGPMALSLIDADGVAQVLPAVSPSTRNAAQNGVVSIGQSIGFEGRHGWSQAWFYPPANDDFVAPQGERPPLIVHSHGGPTGFASSADSAEVQFWTSRGFGYLDVNYSGSSRFGRAYRNRLLGQWGVADVEDCVDAVAAVLSAGLADPKRVSIVGGSAGGYTTLQALVTSDSFTAGVSRYGIGDLELLQRDTHKFEAHYTEALVGPYPTARDVFVERSPIHHVERLRTPMLIMQGTADKVVPPNQAILMADAVRAQGLPVALLLFEGEGHGFRRVSTRRAALEAELSFYAQLWGFSPADPVPPLSIDNLL